MDWYLEGEGLDAVTDLRDEFLAYLSRHATEHSDQLGAALVFSEVVSNAVVHSEGPVWVSLDWSARQLILRVYDLGPGFDADDFEMPPPSSTGGRGLAIAADVARRLEVGRRPGHGSVVEAELPVERPDEESHNPEARRRGVLPALSEATPSGFGRESFLRALVVQLAQEAERAHGPSAAQALVAQVGTDVGGRMEEEYRLAKNIVGRLGPEQVADCLVRLKHAIDGDFYVLEADDERIVLGNRRCPFGDAVKAAPALCRMTSSVFGGVAARNLGDTSVLLEQRIAVGDPQCVVVIDVRPDPSRPGHRYAAPDDIDHVEA